MNLEIGIMSPAGFPMKLRDMPWDNILEIHVDRTISPGDPAILFVGLGPAGPVKWAITLSAIERHDAEERALQNQAVQILQDKLPELQQQAVQLHP